MIRRTAILMLLLVGSALATPVVIKLKTVPSGAEVYLLTSSSKEKGLYLGTSDAPIPIEQRFLDGRASLDLRIEKKGFHGVTHNLKTLAITEGAVLPGDGPVRLPRDGVNLGGFVAVACVAMVLSVALMRRKSEQEGLPLEEADSRGNKLSLDPLVGIDVCGYVLEKAFDKGGMGTIYLAHQLEDPAVQAAVKIIDLTGHHESAHKRFQRELAVASKLHHPAIVQTWDYCTLEERYLAIVMEYLDGCPLSKFLRPGHRSPAQVLKLLEPVFGALGYLHEKGIVHRDIKPQNIFVLQDERTKLIDFGLAREDAQEALTRTGMLVGTPRYMAPEQISRRNPVSPASDQYAMGLILFEYITGRPPYDVDDARKILMDHLCQDPSLAHEVNNEVPERFALALARMYHRDPGRRYESMEAALLALKGAL